MRNLEELLRLGVGVHRSTIRIADRRRIRRVAVGDRGQRRCRRRLAMPIDLATFHAAKGLEWPIVHLAGLEDGLVPIGHARTEEAVAEERRLFYVAVTRAELSCV